MAKISIDEPRNYPTSKTSVHGRYQAKETRRFKEQQAAKREKELQAKQARLAARKDRVQLGQERGDADIQKMTKLGKSPRTQKQRLARRRALMLKGTSEEKAWRNEAKSKKQNFMPDSESKESLRRAGASRAKDVKNSGNGGSLVVSNFNLSGKAGTANAMLSVPSYVNSAHQAFKSGDAGQVTADLLVAGGAVAEQMGEHTTLLSKEAGGAIATGAGGAAAVNDLVHGVYDFATGSYVDGTDRMANALLGGLSSIPGPLGVVGKVGTATDLAMNVCGGDQFIQDGYEGVANAEYKQINENGKMQARLMAKKDAAYIKAHRKEATEALRYLKEDAVNNYADEARLDNDYQQIVRLRKALAKTR